MNFSIWIISHFYLKQFFFSKKQEKFIIYIYLCYFTRFFISSLSVRLIPKFYWNTLSARFSVKDQKSQLEVSSSKSSPFDFNWNERRSKGSQSRNSKSSALTIENVNIYPTLIPCQSLIIRAIYSANICVA